MFVKLYSIEAEFISHLSFRLSAVRICEQVSCDILPSLILIQGKFFALRSIVQINYATRFMSYLAIRCPSLG